MSSNSTARSHHYQRRDSRPTQGSNDVITRTVIRPSPQRNSVLFRVQAKERHERDIAGMVMGKESEHPLVATQDVKTLRKEEQVHESRLPGFPCSMTRQLSASTTVRNVHLVWVMLLEAVRECPLPPSQGTCPSLSVKEPSQGSTCCCPRGHVLPPTKETRGSDTLYTV